MKRTRWDARRYQNHAAFVPNLATDILQQLNPQAGETILDLGCGDGSLSQKINNSGCHLLCVDASQSMVDSAHSKGLNADVLDGHAIPYRQQFDAVFSNAALHWMQQPEQVLSGIFQALKPGGRLVAEFGGKGNIQQLVSVMTQVFADHPSWGKFNNPWYFPSTQAYQQCLEAQGFQVQQCDAHHRPTAIDGPLRGWLEVFCQGICAELSDNQREVFYLEAENRLTGHIGTIERTLTLDYIRLKVVARKPIQTTPANIKS